MSKLKPAIEYMNDLCSWTIEEGVPPFDKRWSGKLAEASDMLAAKDAELQSLRRRVMELEAVEAAARHVVFAHDRFMQRPILEKSIASLAAALSSQDAAGRGG